MIAYTLEPHLIQIGNSGYIRMLLNIGAAMSTCNWEVGKTDDGTGLLTGTKDDARFHCGFFWSDSESSEVDVHQATHLGVIVRSANANERDCLREQHALATAIKTAAFGTLDTLGIFNH